jgi:tRNA(fMet)-specific endonuclease VapC
VTFKFLLDTNIVSDLVRRPQGRVADAIAAKGEATVATSIIVAAELRFGAVKSGSRKLVQQLDAILGALPVLPFETPAESRYAEVRARLEKAGTRIGGNDLLIAAHALALDLVLVTANLREFKRVKGLRCVDWLRDDA